MKNCIALLCLVVLISVPVSAMACADYDGPADVTVQIDGLVCDACARSIEKVFLKNETVQAVVINLDTKTVSVDTKKGQTLKDEDIQKMIYYAGYKVADIKRAC